VIEGLFALRDLKKAITNDDLPATLKQAPRATVVEAAGEVHSLAESEKVAIIRALQATEGNKSRAAEMLGISRDRLYRKIELYGIEAS